MAAEPRKTVLITGAARGIGLATARRFLAEGWCAALLDIDGAAQEKAAAGLEAPDRVLALSADVADEAQVAAALAAVAERFGRLDALVNNAGVAVFKPFMETTPAEWARVLAVNLTGPFLCARAAVPLMTRRAPGRASGGEIAGDTRGGAIVNIASISGQRASTLRVAYGTSKAGVMHLTKQMAAELAALGIRANCVAPGPVETAMAKAVHTPEIRADYHAAIPLDRYGLEDEIADAIFYLCSPRASYVTGQTLAVDGGFDATGIGLPTLRREAR